MGVPSQHFYRFTYLKSDHWQDLRLRKLVSVDAKCELCSTRDIGNDIHHLRYRNLWDVEISDLVCLCRPCHGLVHSALERYREEIKQAGEKKTWKVTCMAVLRVLAPATIRDPAKEKRSLAMQNREVRMLFCELRKVGFWK